MAQNRHWEQDKEATVYIGNIDERATSSTVYEIMLQMGPIHNIHIPRDRVTQSHQGFGFVEYRTPADAEYASQVMNGVKLYGKSLRVNPASDSRRDGGPGGSGAANSVGAELFVGNLDPNVDERVLYDTFSRFGPLLALPKVARDDAGASKGFGFVSFGDFESSDAAVSNLHGQYIFNKEVSVQYAFKKDGKGERHGDEAERALAKEAKKRNIVPEAQAIPQAFLHPGGVPPAAAAPVGFDQQQQQQPPQHQPPHMGMNGGMPPQMPAGFQQPPPYRGGPPPPPASYSAGGPPPGMPPPSRAAPGAAAPGAPGGAHLPPPPSGLPARPPQGQRGGYPNPADYHPGSSGFRPPSGSPGAQGYGGPGAPPPGFGPPGGAAPPPGAPPPPPGFMPPPGFQQQPPPGFQPRR